MTLTPVKPRPAKCQSCGAAIYWAEIDGKRIPVNKTRARVYDVAKGVLPFLEVRDGHGKPSLFYVSHFLTCPNASAHSRGRKAGE